MMLKANNNQHGFSLIEMLIAMTLGLILLSGMIAVFAGNKRSAEMNTAMANIQENARYALSAIAKDIRMSGFQGCLDLERGALNVVANPPTNVPLRQDGGFRASASTGAVIGPNGQWTPDIVAAGINFVPPANRQPVPGSHALILQFGSGNASTLTQQMTVGTIPSLAAPMSLSRNLGLGVGDMAIISNCDSADLFRVTGTALAGAGQTLQHAATLNVSGNVSNEYGDPRTINSTKVMRFMSNIYYVADTGLSNEFGDPIRALYQQSLPYNSADNPPTELVQGVENMRVAFGIKNGTALRYVTADDPTFVPQNVESIQLGLLMTSWDRIAEQDDNNTYLLAGQPIEPSDNAADATTHARDQRYRLVFNTTVKVRNRRNE